MTNLATGVLFVFCFLCGLGIGRLWGIVKAVKEKRATLRSLDTFATDYFHYLRKCKFLDGQIKGFKKAGGELLSLTIKSLNSIDKGKLRTIRRFRSLLTWAEKYLA